MFSFIKGILESKDTNLIEVDCNGIGYEINVAVETLAKLPALGDKVKIYTYMKVSEDNISLFGFLSKEEKEMFLLLLTVNGVGPKAAINIAGFISPDKLILAIVSEDEALLSKAQGVGKKTASRIIMELKDKLKKLNLSAFAQSQQTISELSVQSGGAKQDTIDALCSLGFTLSEATKATLLVYDEGLTAEQMIKLALKKLT